jgi:hypothetical protein
LGQSAAQELTQIALELEAHDRVTREKNSKKYGTYHWTIAIAKKVKNSAACSTLPAMKYTMILNRAHSTTKSGTEIMDAANTYAQLG